MKKTIVLILAVLFLLTSCNAEETTSTVSEQYANADDYLYRTWGYGSWKDFHFENAIWLETDGSGAFDVKVPMGTVQVSPYLVKAMEDMPDNLRLRVIVSFKSMLPEEYWNTVLEGKTVREYYEIIESEEDLKAANLATDLLYPYKHEWFYKIYRTIHVSDEQAALGGITDDFCFYACMTKKEILELTCNEDEAFYIFAAIYK
jgi:hypothetical protein